jgi:hypothetical protein
MRVNPVGISGAGDRRAGRGILLVMGGNSLSHILSSSRGYDSLSASR